MKAYSFQLKNQFNELTDIKKLNYQWLVLYFYPKDNTPGCTNEAIDFSTRINEFEKIGAKVIGISPDSVESHKKFCEKYNLTVTLLSDPEKKIILKYKAWGLKKNYGKEYEGLIRSTVIIDNEFNIVKRYDNVRVRVKNKNSVKYHAEIVLSDIMNLIEKE